MSHAYRETTRDWPDRLRRLLPEHHFRHVEETGSTNEDLLRAIRSGEVGPLCVISADHQTAGRGRRGDKWESPAGANLLFSLSLSLPEDRAAWGRLPHFAAYALGRSLESILGDDARIQTKWPNDLHLAGRKIAGILVETVLTAEPVAVVGIGCNINTRPEDFPPSLRSIATSLYEHLGCESSRWYLLGLVLREFLDGYPDKTITFDTVRDWLSSRDALLDRALRLETAGGSVEGIARGVGDGGELRLETADGTVVSVISAERICLC